MTTREARVARGVRLEYLTVAWNLLEAFIAILSGVIAGSIALVGFGLDSMIEVFSGGVLLWRLRSDLHPESRERTERMALRLVGLSFLSLGAYVTFEAMEALVRHEAPAKSIPGVALAIASVIVMPLLARAKRKVARDIESRALQADSRQTDFCAYLSAILLIGLTLNGVVGWWWADPFAALIMVPFIVREGIKAIQGVACCDDALCGTVAHTEQRSKG
ncbi:MAG: cation transporter [Acidobacteriia bacterium]|nr:cation transporter [Terriglobia bacterium]